MKTICVVPWVDRFGNFGFNFNRDVIRGEHLEPGTIIALAQCQHRRQRWRGRVREQTVDAIFRNRQLRVVVVVCMHRNAVGEGGKSRRHFQVRADDRAASGGGDAERLKVSAYDAPGFGGIARKRQTQPIQDGALAQMHHIGGNLRWLRVSDELRHIGGEGWFVGHGSEWGIDKKMRVRLIPQCDMARHDYCGVSR